MSTDLGKAESVAIERLFLDPNNPRLGRERTGYDDPRAIFPEEIQKELEEKMREMYEIADLEETILAQGWVPIDAILVWEHPKKKGQYVVVEGNSRTTALRGIRRRHVKLREQHEKHLKKKGMDKDILDEERRQLEKLEKVIKETNILSVLPVEAKDSADLMEKLPRLLGVRHISHAQQWKPYPTNLYIAGLYRKAFREVHGDKKLELDRNIVKRIGEVVSLGETKTRRSIQAAISFERFKHRWEDKLPEGQHFLDEDHYFFELILQNKYPQEQFGFDKDGGLEVPAEGEKVLFQWAFSKPRHKGKENPNIFYKAENLRLWNEIKKYDDDHKTEFAARLDVEDPDKATPMSKIEADYLSHKARQSPADVLQGLVDALKELKVDTLRSQALHVEPLIRDLVKVGKDCLDMMNAVQHAKQ